MLLPTFLLVSAALVIFSVALLLHFLALLVTLFALLIEFFGALTPLNDNLLRLANPLNVLDEGLLNLVVAHCVVEGLFGFTFTYLQVTNLLENFFNPRSNIDQVVLLKLLGLVEDGLFFLNLSDLIFQRVDYSICRRHRCLNLFSLLLNCSDLATQRFNLFHERH